MHKCNTLKLCFITCKPARNVLLDAFCLVYLSKMSLACVAFLLLVMEKTYTFAVANLKIIYITI
jgi:hypothetical protein